MTPRQQRTLIYLLLSTLLGSVFASFTNSDSPLGKLVFFVPILFGVALIVSNDVYLKNHYGLGIPVYFFLIFMFGSPFIGSVLLMHNQELTRSLYFQYTSGFAAFLLVFLCVKLFLTDVEIGIWQIVMLLSFPLLSTCLVSILSSFVGLEQHGGNFVVTVPIYQSLMTILIVSSMRINNTEKEKISNSRPDLSQLDYDDDA